METLIILGVVAVILIAFILWAIGVNNALVRLKNRFENAYSQIDVQLQRRHDLIPNLVETAKGYMKHERETLEAVIAARNSAQSAAQSAAKTPGDPAAMGALASAEAGLTGALGRFFALSEAYPDLKADSTMTNIQEELTSSENKIAFARQAFNDAIMQYNTKREVFPDSIIAGMRNFNEAQFFEIEDPKVKETPKVSFD